ncbi:MULTISPECIES: hypothetical protein [Psychrobacter]|jgi:hypothetical protein|nr:MULTISPECIES: hypothetical protein [Psychrobacter]
MAADNAKKNAEKSTKKGVKKPVFEIMNSYSSLAQAFIPKQ